MCLLFGVGQSWAAEGDTHDFTQTLSQLLNNNASISSITIPQQTYPVKEIKVTWRYNKATEEVVTIAVSVGSTSFGSEKVGKNTTSTSSFTGTSTTGAITISFTNHAGSGTGKGTFYVTNVQLVEGASEGGSTPSTPTVTAPTLDVAAGTYTEDQLVLIDNYDDNYLYAYTTDGTDPAFGEELNVTNGKEYDNNKGIEITSSCTLKVIAVDEDGNASSITSAAYVINKPLVFTSLEKLVAADLTSGTNVTVSFENVAIKDIYVTNSGYRNGIYFDIQKEDKDIEIYFQNVPATWIVGGTVSGTLTNCPWKKYNGTWELAPASGWAWTNLTYNAPAQKTITALAVSGTPTKTTYNVGDAFETAGLVVTATYSDDTTAPIATGFEWEIDYGTGNEALVAGATSVNVMAYTDEVMSDVYTVNGLTVTVPVTLTSIAVSGTPTKTTYYVGDAFETAGLVVTGTYSDSHQEVITEGIEWTIDPETLAEGTTTVDVLAGVGSVVSEVYAVSGLTVTKPDFETVTYEFSSFDPAKVVQLTDLDGFVITLSGGTTNPGWVSNQARVYASGSLTVKANNAIIKSIEYEYVVNANKNKVTPTIDGVEGTTDAGTWDEENKTWTGADEEVTFSTSGSAGNVGFTKLVIKYVESTKIETSLAWSATEAEVTIGADNNVFPTLTTTPVDLAGVTYASSNTEVATIAEDGTITLIKAGETTIAANFAGDAEHASASPVSYTLTVIKAPFVPTPVAEGYETVDFAALYSSVTTNATVEDYEGTSFAMAFAKPQSSTTPTKYYDNGKAVRAYEGNTITITAAEPIKFVDIAWAGNYVDDAVSIEGLDTKTAVVTFSKTCRFTAITVSYKEIAINILTDEGYATFVSKNAVKLPEGLKAAVAEVSNGQLAWNWKYDSGSTIPAKTPVLVKGSKGEHTGFATAGGNAPESNYLFANMTEDSKEASVIAPDSKYYFLSYGDEDTGFEDKLGFYYYNENGASFEIPVGKVFLALPSNVSGSAKAAYLLTDDTTAISSIENTSEKNNVAYNLAGQRVNANAKGIVIINGKKVLKK